MQGIRAFVKITGWYSLNPPQCIFQKSTCSSCEDVIEEIKSGTGIYLQDFHVSTAMSSNSAIFSFVVSNLLLIPSSVFIYNCIFSSQKVQFDLFFYLPLCSLHSCFPLLSWTYAVYFNLLIYYFYYLDHFRVCFYWLTFLMVTGYIFIPGHILVDAKHHLRCWVLDFLVLVF